MMLCKREGELQLNILALIAPLLLVLLNQNLNLLKLPELVTDFSMVFVAGDSQIQLSERLNFTNEFSLALQMRRFQGSVSHLGNLGFLKFVKF